MVFQNYALYPHKTVFENLAFPLKLRPRQCGYQATRRPNRIHPRTERATRSQAAAAFRWPEAASGDGSSAHPRAAGVPHGRAALEPRRQAANSDASGDRLLHKEIGVTTIYVTHDQIEAMTLGDRVAVMRLGELQQVAHPTELYTRPANLFVAGFIGSPAMNFFEGSLESREDGSRSVRCDGQRLAVDGAERDWQGDSSRCGRRDRRRPPRTSRGRIARATFRTTAVSKGMSASANFSVRRSSYISKWTPRLLCAPRCVRSPTTSTLQL